MSKYKFDAHIRIQNESLDIQFYLSGEIDIDFDPDDEPGDPHDGPDVPFDEPGEDDESDLPDGDPNEPNWSPINYN